MSDLIERLHAAQLRGNTAPSEMHLLEEAAERIAELETKLDRVRKGHGVGAIPETTEYANGWNDCRQHIHDELEALLKGEKP